MTKKHPQRQRIPSRQPVRAGDLNRTLTGFNADIGHKVSLLIEAYHTRHIEPRLDWLETPWYKKLWWRLKEVARWLNLKLKVKKNPQKIESDHILLCDCGAEEPHSLGAAGCKFYPHEEIREV
jgi:hypothetical protein